MQLHDRRLARRAGRLVCRHEARRRVNQSSRHEVLRRAHHAHHSARELLRSFERRSLRLVELRQCERQSSRREALRHRVRYRHGPCRREVCETR
ncbi:hypothetical protein D3C86_1852390 [compost metagenome]